MATSMVTKISTGGLLPLGKALLPSMAGCSFCWFHSKPIRQQVVVVCAVRHQIRASVAIDLHWNALIIIISMTRSRPDTVYLYRDLARPVRATQMYF
jgi:hypothetical protein